MTLPLKQWRQQAEKTQAEAAEALGIDRTIYTRIEAGTRALKADELGVLARFFKVQADEVYRAIASAGDDPAEPTESAA